MADLDEEFINDIHNSYEEDTPEVVGPEPGTDDPLASPSRPPTKSKSGSKSGRRSNSASSTETYLKNRSLASMYSLLSTTGDIQERTRASKPSIVWRNTTTLSWKLWQSAKSEAFWLDFLAGPSMRTVKNADISVPSACLSHFFQFSRSSQKNFTKHQITYVKLGEPVQPKMKTVNKLDTNVWDEDHGLLSTPNSRKGTCGSMSWWQLALGAWAQLYQANYGAYEAAAAKGKDDGKGKNPGAAVGGGMGNMSGSSMCGSTKITTTPPCASKCRVLQWKGANTQKLYFNYGGFNILELDCDPPSNLHCNSTVVGSVTSCSTNPNVRVMSCPATHPRGMNASVSCSSGKQDNPVSAGCPSKSTVTTSHMIYTNPTDSLVGLCYDPAFNSGEGSTVRPNTTSMLCCEEDDEFVQRDCPIENGVPPPTPEYPEVCTASCASKCSFYQLQAIWQRQVMFCSVKILVWIIFVGSYILIPWPDGPGDATQYISMYSPYRWRVLTLWHCDGRRRGKLHDVRQAMTHNEQEGSRRRLLADLKDFAITQGLSADEAPRINQQNRHGAIQKSLT
eukprot:g23661.t1